MPPFAHSINFGDQERNSEFQGARIREPNPTSTFAQRFAGKRPRPRTERNSQIARHWCWCCGRIARHCWPLVPCGSTLSRRLSKTWEYKNGRSWMRGQQHCVPPAGGWGIIFWARPLRRTSPRQNFSQSSQSHLPQLVCASMIKLGSLSALSTRFSRHPASPLPPAPPSYALAAPSNNSLGFACISHRLTHSSTSLHKSTVSFNLLTQCTFTWTKLWRDWIILLGLFWTFPDLFIIYSFYIEVFRISRAILGRVLEF